MSKNKNILIHKAEKGNTIVILDKISYISAIEEILNDHTKFSDLDIPAGKEINYITNLQKTVTSDLKLLKDEEIIDKATYKNIKLVGSRPCVLCRLGSAQGNQQSTTTFPSDFVSCWYAYLKTSKTFTIIFDTFNSK